MRPDPETLRLGRLLQDIALLLGRLTSSGGGAGALAGGLGILGRGGPRLLGLRTGLSRIGLDLTTRSRCIFCCWRFTGRSLLLGLDLLVLLGRLSVAVGLHVDKLGLAVPSGIIATRAWTPPTILESIKLLCSWLESRVLLN